MDDPGDGNAAPLWLRLLAGSVVAIVAAATIYAVLVGLENFGRIGV